MHNRSRLNVSQQRLSPPQSLSGLRVIADQQASTGDDDFVAVICLADHRVRIVDRHVIFPAKLTGAFVERVKCRGQIVVLHEQQ